MDILVLLIWIVVILIVHVLLSRFLEMRDITNKIVMQYNNAKAVPTPVQILPEPEPEQEQKSEVSMEQELMEYVYNYQDPVIDGSDKKLDIGSGGVGDLSSRLTPNDATNIVANYGGGGGGGDYECYNDIHDEYAL